MQFKEVSEAFKKIYDHARGQDRQLKGRHQTYNLSITFLLFITQKAFCIIDA